MAADHRACRLTGFATLSGVGAYALYEAGQQGAFAKIRPKGKPIVGAQITAVVGVGECSSNVEIEQRSVLGFQSLSLPRSYAD